MSGRPPLAALQRWMQVVITCPDGVAEGAASAAARAALDVAPEAIGAVVRPSVTLSAAERLATYHRAYEARLLAAFRDMFPALRDAVGDELLDAFAMDHLASHPPRSFTLADAADRFPEHLEATRPDRDAPPDRREAWPSFLVELARLELAVLQVAEGPGLEGRPPPETRALLALPPGELLRRRPVPAPCLRLFACAWPVHRYLRAVRAGAAPALPEPARCHFAVSRREYRVVLHDLAMIQYVFLRACDGRRAIEDALDVLAGDGVASTPEPGNVRDWLCEWAARGLLQAID